MLAVPYSSRWEDMGQICLYAPTASIKREKTDPILQVGGGLVHEGFAAPLLWGMAALVGFHHQG